MKNFLETYARHQNYSYDCGYFGEDTIFRNFGERVSIKSLKSIAFEAQKNLNVSQKEIRESRGITKKGKINKGTRKYPALESTGIIAIAKKKGYAGTIMLNPSTKEIMQIIDNGLPVLFDWYLKPNIGHWSVIKGYVRGKSKTNGKTKRTNTWFRIADSNDCERLEYNIKREKLFSQWKGDKGEERRAIIQWPADHPKSLEFRTKYRGMPFGPIPKESYEENPKINYAVY